MFFVKKGLHFKILFGAGCSVQEKKCRKKTLILAIELNLVRQIPQIIIAHFFSEFLNTAIILYLFSWSNVSYQPVVLSVYIKRTYGVKRHFMLLVLLANLEILSVTS